MKRLVGLLILLLIVVSTCIPFAYAQQVQPNQDESIDCDALERSAPDVLQDEDPKNMTDLSRIIPKLKQMAGDAMKSAIKGCVKSGGMLLIIVLLSAAACDLCDLGDGLGKQAVRLGGASAVTMVALSDVNSMMGLGRQTIEQLNTFTTVLMPTLSTAAVASGSAVSAPIKQGITLLCSNLLTSLIEGLLLPLTLGYAGLCVACAAVGEGRLKGLCKLIRWCITGLLTSCVVLYTGYLTISGAVATTADAAAVKATQMAISGFVPIVGGILSDATGAILSGAALLKSSIGIFGVIGVLAFVLVPFIRLGIQFVVYKFVAALSSVISSDSVSVLIQDLGGVFALVMGMTGSCALVVLLSLLSVVSAVTV